MKQLEERIEMDDKTSIQGEKSSTIKMRPRIKLGLLVGIGGLFLNFLLPCMSVFSAAIAGYLAAKEEKLTNKRDGVVAGAVAGGIAGILTSLGWIILVMVLSRSATEETNDWFTLFYQIQIVSVPLVVVIGAGFGYAGASAQPLPDSRVQ